MKQNITFLFFIIFTLVLSAQTVTIEGGSSYGTIQEAIDASADGDVILITGTHTEAISFGKSITLRGVDPTTDIIQEAASAVSDGSGAGVVNVIRGGDTDVLNVTIENLGIRNGNSGENGGGINVDKVTDKITLKNLIIENNYSAKNGGGLSIAGSNGDVLECTIKNNSSTLDGGGLIAAPNNGVTINSTININQSLIDNNTGRNGGAIYINGNPGFGDNNLINVNLENSTVSNNNATSPSGGNGGGSIWSKSATFTGAGAGTNINLQLVHATLYNNSHVAATKQGMRFTGTSDTNFSAYNSIIVNADLVANRAINFLGANATNIVNCILGGLENAGPFLSIIDDANKNNLKGRTSAQAGLTGTLTDEGGNTQVLAVVDASNAVDFCTAAAGLTLPTIDQRGATRTGTPDAGAFEFGGTLGLGDKMSKNNLVRIFPNPAQEFVKISGLQNIKVVRVYSVIGALEKVVYNQKELNVSNLSKGLHLITIEDDNSNIATKRLIVK